MTIMVIRVTEERKSARYNTRTANAFPPRFSFCFSANLEFLDHSSSGFLKLAVNRCRNYVIELLFPSTSMLEDLIFVSNECPSLKILGLPLVLVKIHNTILPTFRSNDEMNHVPRLVAKWKDLERMHIQDNPPYFKEILVQISLHCKNFTGLNKSGYMDDDEALAIVDFLPKLKYLTLTSAFLSKKNLKLILEGWKNWL
ncbi:hypothetical protein HHK36_021477 [Tetracentron sinense]|uniref:Uncharacterized protein n=1 Tax=Tetracentron sinense TaxID=13715 RepID=A0A834YUF1_TETSI|nr:hypothetical protein HHK36_021477 [Tetracentron sinense]